MENPNYYFSLEPVKKKFWYLLTFHLYQSFNIWFSCANKNSREIIKMGSKSSIENFLNANPCSRFVFIQPLINCFFVLQHLWNLTTIHCQLNLFLYHLFDSLQLFIYATELWFYLRIQMTTTTHYSIIYRVK